MASGDNKNYGYRIYNGIIEEMILQLIFML